MKMTLSVAMSDPSHLVPLAKAAEEAGFDAIAVPDSIFYSEEVSARYPYTSDGARLWKATTPFVEPFVAIPAMAAVTERIFFYTAVLKLAVRNPLLVAKTVTSVAAMAPGRVGLGVGLGWLPEEFTWCGTDYDTRGPRANEAIEILRLIFDSGGEMVSYDGAHYQFGKLTMSPLPSQRIPIYVGGHSKPGLRRAAKYADGWCSAMIKEADLREIVAELTRLRGEYGRAEEPFEIQAVPVDAAGPDAYRRLEDAGVTDIMTVPWAFSGGGMDPPLQAKLDSIRFFADAVLAKMR